MGGFGSRRPSGSGRDTVEACRSIDVNRRHKPGCLQPGWWGGWQWTRDGEKVASISLRAEFDRLHLSYRVRVGGGEREGCGRDRPHRPRAQPVRWRSPPFYLSRCGEPDQLRPARRQAARAGALLPLPALLPTRPCRPERWPMGNRRFWP